MEVAENQLWRDKKDGQIFLVVRAVNKEWFTVVGTDKCTFNPEIRVTKNDMQALFDRDYYYCGTLFNTNKTGDFAKYECDKCREIYIVAPEAQVPVCCGQLPHLLKEDESKNFDKFDIVMK